MRWKSACLFAGLLALAASWPGSPAAAQDDPAALIEEGITLRESGRDDEALARFQRAYELAPSPQALVQIALAEQALGLWVDAHTHLTEALRAAADPWIAARRAALDGALEAMERRVGRLDLREGVDGAEVWVNGVQAGTLPLAEPLTVRAGTIVLEIRAEGYVTLRRTLEVSPGGVAREQLAMVPLAATESAASDREAPDDAGSRRAAVEERATGGGISPVGPIVLGVGGAILVSGVIVGALSFVQADDFQRACANLDACDPAHRSAYDEMRTLSAVADGLMVGGAAVAVLGLVLTFVLPGDDEAPVETACGPAGCVVRGRF